MAKRNSVEYIDHFRRQAFLTQCSAACNHSVQSFWLCPLTDKLIASEYPFTPEHSDRRMSLNPVALSDDDRKMKAYQLGEEYRSSAIEFYETIYPSEWQDGSPADWTLLAYWDTQNSEWEFTDVEIGAHF